MALRESSDDAGDESETIITLDLPAGGLSPGQILGRRCGVRKLLGRGAMGEVWCV